MKLIKGEYMKTSLILTCAGKGERAGFNSNKLLQTKNGKTYMELALNKFVESGVINEYIVVVSKEDFSLVSKLLPTEIKIVVGGNTRTQSVKNALKEVSGDIVLIHDGARPYVSYEIIKNCIETAKKFGSAIPTLPVTNSVCKVNNNNIENYIDRNTIYEIQTPQGFNAEQIKKAYSLINEESFTDDGSVYYNFIGKPATYSGDIKNVKLTFKEDFVSALRYGTGFDCHKLVEERKLILGGVEIPHSKGLLGHSDADVLTHAIMDSILSGIGLKDIGYYFPDTDEKYKGANSIELLKDVLKMAKERGYVVYNVSATIMAEKPKLLNFIPLIKSKLASVLGIEESFVGITATTLEGLGFVGREEGICVNAVVSLIEE